jgi:hypothetical protein
MRLVNLTTVGESRNNWDNCSHDNEREQKTGPIKGDTRQVHGNKKRAAMARRGCTVSKIFFVASRFFSR